MTTANEVAEWMVNEVAKEPLTQISASERIKELFGGEFLRETDNGNLGVSKAVLRQFSKLHAGTVTQ